jgi:hypothetical protein
MRTIEYGSVDGSVGSKLFVVRVVHRQERLRAVENIRVAAESKKEARAAVKAIRPHREYAIGFCREVK